MQRQSKTTYYQAEEVIGRRIINKKVFYLVKWKGFSVQEATWEKSQVLKFIKNLVRRYNNKNKTQKDETFSQSYNDNFPQFTPIGNKSVFINQNSGRGMLNGSEKKIVKCFDYQNKEITQKWRNLCHSNLILDKKRQQIQEKHQKKIYSKHKDCRFNQVKRISQSLNKQQSKSKFEETQSKIQTEDQQNKINEVQTKSFKSILKPIGKIKFAQPIAIDLTGVGDSLYSSKCSIKCTQSNINDLQRTSDNVHTPPALKSHKVQSQIPFGNSEKQLNVNKVEKEIEKDKINKIYYLEIKEDNLFYLVEYSTGSLVKFNNLELSEKHPKEFIKFLEDKFKANIHKN